MFTICKTFTASKSADREALGERVTEWIRTHPYLEVVDAVVTQSSDNSFHLLAITLFAAERGRG